jgi:hypothetical protein
MCSARSDRAFHLLLRQIEDLAGVAQNQFVCLPFGLIELLPSRIFGRFSRVFSRCSNCRRYRSGRNPNLILDISGERTPRPIMASGRRAAAAASGNAAGGTVRSGERRGEDGAAVNAVAPINPSA